MKGVEHIQRGHDGLAGAERGVGPAAGRAHQDLQPASLPGERRRAEVQRHGKPPRGHLLGGLADGRGNQCAAVQRVVEAKQQVESPVSGGAAVLEPALVGEVGADLCH